MNSSSKINALVGAIALFGPLIATAQPARVAPSPASQAQTQPQTRPATAPGPAAAKAAPAAAGYHAAPPEQRADKMSQEMARQLSLDAATTAKVRAAALVRAQKIDAIQTGTTSNKAKNTALEANAQEFKQTLQGILTPAQYAQYAGGKGGKGGKGKGAAAPATPAPAVPKSAGY